MLSSSLYEHLLDMPNTKRHFKICACSIPVFQRASNISKHIFNCVRQNFKELLQNNTHDDSNILYMQLIGVKYCVLNEYLYHTLWHNGCMRF